MANHAAVTIPLENIQRVQLYINSPRKTVAQIKEATGADYILNGTLYNLNTGAVNCHLKVHYLISSCSCNAFLVLVA